MAWQQTEGGSRSVATEHVMDSDHVHADPNRDPGSNRNQDRCDQPDTATPQNEPDWRTDKNAAEADEPGDLQISNHSSNHST